jgi:phage protein U
MLLAFGLFVFELPSLLFDELQRRTDWRHASNERVGARDASQFLGPGKDHVSISGTLLPEVAGSFASIRTLRTMADEGEAWPLTAGTGQVLGNFVLVALDERQKFFTLDGVPRRTDFVLELERVS